MEYGENNREWRQEIKAKLSKLGILCFDPYDHPFIHDLDEGQQVKLKQLRERGNLNELEEKMKDIRRYDLSAVDRSDFIICVIDPDVPTWGTIDELVMAEALNRPVFMVVKGGKRKAPLWLYSLVPHRYMYNNLDEVIDVLCQINNGSVQIDSKRWKLMKEEYR